MYADRVKDTTLSTGTGAITLAGVAPTGYQTFAAGFGSSAVTVAYCIADQAGNNWEVGVGTFDGTIGLTRTTVLGSSNAGAPVAFTAGTKDVFCTAPAKYLDTFTSTNQGTVPASGGGTSNFLRADGTFAAPPSGAPASPTTSVQFNNAGAFGGSANFFYTVGTDTLSVGKLVSANFTSAAQGLVPASGGGTANFLRADGTFAAPPTTAPAGATTQIQFNNAGAFGASANFTYATATNTFTVGPAGATTTIETLAPTGATVAGTLTVRGKNASATNGNGGPINLTTGNGVGTGVGGVLTLRTGTSSAGNGGQLAMRTGSGVGTGASGGDLDIQLGGGVGASGGYGGSFFVNSGFASPDFGGTFYILGGGGGIGGTFAMGCGGSTTGSGGDLTFSMAGGPVDDGNLYVQDGYGRNFMQCRTASGGGGAQQIGFFEATPVIKPTITGSRSTQTVTVLANLLTALANLGLITNSTTA
jgi:hypothetical protein